MKAKRIIAGLLILSLTASTACIDQNSVFAPLPTEGEPSAHDAAEYMSMTPEEICKSLTLEQKAAQMMQPTIYNVDPVEMAVTDYGSILSRVDTFRPTPPPVRSLTIRA